MPQAIDADETSAGTSLTSSAPGPPIKGRLTTAQFDVTRHDAVITISNPVTGDHRTFKIETASGDWMPGKRVVGLLTGPDNTRDYKWFGFVDDHGVRVWRKCQGGLGNPPSIYEKYARMLEMPSRYVARGAVYQISANCRRCGRVLTVNSSLTTGYGPECSRKAGIS